MTEIKPIAVIYFPHDFSFTTDGRIVDCLHLMKEFNGWNEQKYQPRENLAGYVWFCFMKESITEPELDVFHPKDFTEIQFQELKDMVMEEIKKLKQQ